ncbi:uncharacterized protein N7511_011131 [Penicillium nucicola]|uniref:uncharacterized protein n=1 Tax=Penicillium nucicola TaxID=1850975 RepID=UPI0025450FB4|nr:uncharacterized protein N7511_011131 [Penicillium nucicola]KAJ5742730.1 hypothetical protein N7511_011131 [Penicillium nucicola]
MCQAHGTECVFPRPNDGYQHRTLVSPRRSSANAKQRCTQRAIEHTRSYPRPQFISRPVELNIISTGSGPEISPASGDHLRAEGLPDLAGIIAEAEDDSSHIVSPAVADDNEILESYLSAVPATRRGPVRTGSSSNRPLRPVRFNIVPRRPLGVTGGQSLAASKCEIIERYMDPHIDEYLNLFFEKANTCFPIFDEALFRSAYFSHKGKMSHSLLCNLYANSLVYWKSSPKLCSGRVPDIRFIWNQANEALHSELFLSPGISTVMSIILNVCGRPSTSMFGNGGMVGTSVALSNALGLNRDPSGWDISPLERSLRIRIWWLVVIHDRWCSLAYGTPLHIHREQYDVPFPSIDDMCSTGGSLCQRTAASIFIALTGLTDVLSRFLEHVYSVSKESRQSEMSAIQLENLLNEWEESLNGDVRRLVLRGTDLQGPGAANLRLAYLAVRLLLRRIQLDINKSIVQPEDDTISPYYMNAQRAAEDIAHLVQELDETQLRGFWIPVHAFSINSATMFLLRSGLLMRHQSRNTPLKTANDIINTLQSHRRKFDWDLADNCLDNCTDLVEKIALSNPQVSTDLSLSEFPDLSDDLEINTGVFDDLFLEVHGFSDGFDL